MYAAIFMGPFARGARDDRALIEQCLQMAVDAADAGFSTITFGEQHFNNYEPYCNPLLMGAQLAGKLKKSYFATTIVPLPFHNPVRLAEDANILDQLLKGRFILGVSQGRVGFSPDFQNFGLDPKDQRAIFAEKFNALQAVWAHTPEKGPIQFDGRWVKGGVHGRLMPASYRANQPHIAIGSNTEATVRRAGVDGHIMFLGPASIDDAASKYKAYKEGLEEGGWDEAYRADRLAKSMVHHQTVVAETEDEAWAYIETYLSFNPLINRQSDHRTVRQMFEDGLRKKAGLSDQEAKNSDVALGWYMAGDPDSIVNQMRQHEERGIQQVHTRFNAGMWNPEGWSRSFKLFVDEVMPRIGVQTFPDLADSDIQDAVRAGPLPPLAGPTHVGVAEANLSRGKAS